MLFPLFTSIIGVSLSIAGLIANSYIQGGDAYLQRLSKPFFFGGDPSIMTYSISLLLKVVSVIISFMLLLYWDNRLRMSRVLIKLKKTIYNKPMMNLLYEEATIHENTTIQTWLTLLSIKTRRLTRRLRLLPASSKISIF
jgi:hypothetical protein